MNAISDHLRRNLFNRVPPESEPPQSSSPEDKLMLHFETINKGPPYDPNNRLLQNKQNQFEQALAQYTSKDSFIDSIRTSQEDMGHLAGANQKVVQAPLVPCLKPSSYDQIRSIREMFSGLPEKQASENYSNNLLVVQQYSQVLMQLGRHNKTAEMKSLAKSKAMIKNPTYSHLTVQDNKIDSKDFESSSTMQRQSSSFQKSKRKDLILMELLREKKRKELVPDYFGVMELKLMELLDYILEDEGEYEGLEAEARIKKVLTNLEKFQGKQIEGQSKINLLRIFFEELTDLKKERQELMTLQRKDERTLQTPMRHLQNKDRQPPTTSTKLKESRPLNTPQKKSTAGKTAKRGSHIKWIQNQAGDRKKKEPKTAKEDRSDIWMGSLC